VQTFEDMKCRVLLADDDPALLEWLSISLSEGGAEVVRASSGAELLERIAEDGPFDLVIADVSMPWMTGVQVARLIREAGLEIPVIIMTGLVDACLPDQVLALGERTSLIRKPFRSEQLEAVIRKLVTDVACASAQS